MTVDEIESADIISHVAITGRSRERMRMYSIAGKVSHRTLASLLSSCALKRPNSEDDLAEFWEQELRRRTRKSSILQAIETCQRMSNLLKASSQSLGPLGQLVATSKAVQLSSAI